MTPMWTHLDKTPRTQAVGQKERGLTGTHIAPNFFREYRSALEAKGGLPRFFQVQP